MLRRYVEYTKIIATVRRKTVSALVYPAILVTLALVLVSIIVLKVVPAFSDFYETFGAQLPLATRVILRASNFIRGNFVFLVVGFVAAVVAVVAWVKQPGQQARFDRGILALPTLGPIARKFATSQMARTLATLLGGGLPLVNALDIAARSIGNQFMAAELDAVSSARARRRVVRARRSRRAASSRKSR